jgi:molybdopterin/thiamine biosynthesis adenylyltransferase
VTTGVGGAGAGGAEAVLGVEQFARAAASPSIPAAESWRPWIVRLLPGELERFAAVCGEHHIVLIDGIDRQLMDLATVRLPAASATERQSHARELLAQQGGSESFGNWVYLPWERKVVHVLGRDDYFEVITNRNRDKLTGDEQGRLRTKRIGVVGLSVGGEAAVTVAQEHLCGEIVLADFDRLDLSNLNRLGAGIDELGVNKAILVARRIVRIDPYLKVTVVEDGVTPANVDAFLDGLDLLIEECDDLQLKFDVRRRARERALDIVFAADERGFLSVEPYAGWPALPPFHGRLEAPQPPKEAYSTRLDFMKALTEWMGGWDRISERSRISLEQEGVLCGYPQLASEARFAAGQVGHIARRLLLGERLVPFFGHVDLDRLVPAAASGDPAGP